MTINRMFETNTELQQVTAVAVIPTQQPAASALMAGLGGGVANDTAVLQRMTNGRLSRAGNALLQLQRSHGNHHVQRVVSQTQNRTRLPDGLKAGVENLSGVSLDDVQVHYNSPKPAQLEALAYAQGTEIHVAPDQEAHLPHEAWHVAQQKLGRVQPTLQLNGTIINDDSHLEREADVMGTKALQPIPGDRAITDSAQQNSETGAVAAHNRQNWETNQSNHDINQPAPAPSPAIVQRYTDVHEVTFNHDGEPEFELMKGVYLEKYSQIQHFLSDIDRTKPYLDALNSELLNNPALGLSTLLTMKNPQEPKELPKLPVAVSPEDFSDMVRSGTLFEDWVGKSHGVQTHRLQWHMINEEFNQEANELRINSIDPIWQNNLNKTMWDLIVDSTDSNRRYDFTQPEKLQNYIATYYRPRLRNLFHKIRQLVTPGFQNRLRGEIEQEQTTFDSNKQTLVDKSPIIRQEADHAVKPGVVENEYGHWTGWKRSSEFEGEKQIVVWTPTIFYPRAVSEELQAWDQGFSI